MLCVKDHCFTSVFQFYCSFLILVSSNHSCERAHPHKFRVAHEDSILLSSVTNVKYESLTWQHSFLVIQQDHSAAWILFIPCVDNVCYPRTYLMVFTTGDAAAIYQQYWNFKLKEEDNKKVTFILLKCLFLTVKFKILYFYKSFQMVKGSKFKDNKCSI